MELTVRGVIITCFTTRYRENYWTALNWTFQNPESCSADEELYTPFVLAGDEAFALREHVLRPYSNKYLICSQLLYNCMLSRTWRIVEWTFGILANKWIIFHRPTNVKPDLCDSINKICSVLHNYIRINDCIQFRDTFYECPLESLQPVGSMGSVAGTESISQSISVRHSGQFPGSVAKCNICFLPARTFLAWKLINR